MLVIGPTHVFENQIETESTYTNAIMSAALNERLKRIPPRARTRADITRPNSIQSTIRVRSIDATMSMLRKLSAVSNAGTYTSVGRGLMLIASSSPIKCLCVGIKPYENGILPSFATALAYSPRTCIGVTPSIQVLSQLMSLSAVKIKDAVANRHGITDMTGFVSRAEYTSRFAMMLRCSYSCVEAGVAFVNSSPVIVNSTARECFTSSVFSEWIANMVAIHAEFDNKLLVLSMGALADECLNEATSAYPSMRSNMSMIRMTNPAAVARMNISRYESSCPISTATTNAELYIDTIVGTSVTAPPRIGFSWNTYSDAILEKFMGSDSVRGLVELLVDHVPGQLLNRVTATIESLYVTMSDSDLEAMIESVGVSQTAIDDANTGEGIGEAQSQYHSETLGGAATTNTEPIINPFNNIETNQSQGGDQSRFGNSHGNEGAGRDGNKFAGPYGVTERSQLGQLLDPSGKGVSQQVIIIESFNQRVNEVVTTFKEMNSNMNEIVRRQAIVIDSLTKMGHVTESAKKDGTEFLDVFVDFCESMMASMDEAHALVQGLPAVVEGDRGIYEAETMPVAPLLRRDDGKTMKQHVYGPAHQSSRANDTGVDPTNGTTNESVVQAGSRINPFTADETDAAIEDTSTHPNLMTDGDETYIEIARQAVVETIRSTEFGGTTTSKSVFDSLRNYPMMIGATSTTMFDVMVTIVAERMTLNSGESLTEGELDNLVGCLGEGSIAEMNEIETVFADAARDDTSIETFFEQLMDEEGDEEN